MMQISASVPHTMQAPALFHLQCAEYNALIFGAAPISVTGTMGQCPSKILGPVKNDVEASLGMQLDTECMGHF